MSQNQLDQRIYERFSARFPVKVKDSAEDFGTMLFLRDASAEGLKITSREKMFINDSVSLEVKLPDGSHPLVLNGQVVWVKTKEPNFLWEIGLKFHKTNLMQVQRLFKFTHPDENE